MSKDNRVNICRYTVKPGKEAEMEALLAKHHPALLEAGLATEDPPMIYRGVEDEKYKDATHSAPRTYIEIFRWKDPSKGPELAHHTPSVMAIWEPMGAICEHMEFPHFEPVSVKK